MLFEDVFLVEIQDAKSTTKHRPQKVFESGSHTPFLQALPFRFWLQAPKWRPLKTEGSEWRSGSWGEVPAAKQFWWLYRMPECTTLEV